MTKIQLTALLQRFMDGTTTVDEEAVLADFFRHATDSDRPADISADDWLAYREMFAMFETPAVADAQRADIVPTDEQTASQQRINYRRLAVWLTTAAAVALLVVVRLVGRQGHDGSVSAELSQPVASLPAGNVADSIASKQEQSVERDSVNQRTRKDAVKPRCPYWQPRPPKVYMAEKAEVKAEDTSLGVDADARKIEEAVSQAEMLLQAISAHQSAELDRLQSQAMDVFADTDTDDYDGDYDGE